MAMGPISSVSVLHTGVGGIQRGLRGAAEAADNIAKAGTDTGTGDNAIRDLTDSSVSLMQNDNLVKASAKVVKTADDMIGTILDVTA